MLKGCKADEELEIRILFDLLDQFFICEPNRALMIKALSAMRNSFNGAPNLLAEWDA